MYGAPVNPKQKIPINKQIEEQNKKMLEGKKEEKKPEEQPKEPKESHVVINGLKIDLVTYQRLADYSTISGHKIHKLIRFAVKRMLSDLPYYDKNLLNAIKTRRGMTDLLVEPKVKESQTKEKIVVS